MRSIEKADALNRLLSRQKSGLNVDDRLIKEIQMPGRLFLISLDSQQEFLDLVWQSMPATRALTPIGSPRTLKDCAFRLEAFNWSFLELQKRGHSWFEKCISIDAGFDELKFDWIAVVPMNDHERRESPFGNYYIFDGVHKTIVLAKKLLRREIGYHPLECLLLTPRRN